MSDAPKLIGPDDVNCTFERVYTAAGRVCPKCGPQTVEGWPDLPAACACGAAWLPQEPGGTVTITGIDRNPSAATITVTSPKR